MIFVIVAIVGKKAGGLSLVSMAAVTPSPRPLVLLNTWTDRYITPHTCRHLSQGGVAVASVRPVALTLTQLCMEQVNPSEFPPDPNPSLTRSHRADNQEAEAIEELWLPFPVSNPNS